MTDVIKPLHVVVNHPVPYTLHDDLSVEEVLGKQDKRIDSLQEQVNSITGNTDGGTPSESQTAIPTYQIESLFT